ncbi:putative membrane protein [Synechococcus sp. PCC 7502]|uniref:phosphate-starvation-inducible PsiE family protein n=1 Tax=Synechococcus sp. PCC 7502 TaxID=1173263 RepID=UPI00029FEB79|nr:phosphate-starvation-inducible PsiE family protein [Synechococcus sp. PCC 7502]AFY73360.1 putative membrane protein [Synechococcus sp. PCC 7502]
MLTKLLQLISSDRSFLQAIKFVENLVSKILAIAMVIVTLVAVIELCVVLSTQILSPPFGFLNVSLIQVFGLFLNILVALEILENITAYLRNHSIQLELVIITSLTAVARKIIIFDTKTQGADLTSLALAIFALSISYWIVKQVNSKKES